MRAVDTALDATSSGCPVHCSFPDEPVQQGNWVTVRRPSHESKHCSSIPIKTLNRFSPLSDAPTEKPDESALVIGDSIVRNGIYSNTLSISQKTGFKYSSFEVMVLHITLSREKSINDKSPVMFVLATVYRPPGHHTDFIKEFGDFLSELVLAADKG